MVESTVGFHFVSYISELGFLGGSDGKVLMQETWVGSLCQEEPLEKGTATHSNILAWRISWTEEPGPWGHRVRHNGATNTQTYSRVTDEEAGNPKDSKKILSSPAKGPGKGQPRKTEILRL